MQAHGRRINSSPSGLNVKKIGMLGSSRKKLPRARQSGGARHTVHGHCMGSLPLAIAPTESVVNSPELDRNTSSASGKSLPSSSSSSSSSSGSSFGDEVASQQARRAHEGLRCVDFGRSHVTKVWSGEDEHVGWDTRCKHPLHQTPRSCRKTSG